MTKIEAKESTLRSSNIEAGQMVNAQPMLNSKPPCSDDEADAIIDEKEQSPMELKTPEKSNSQQDQQ